MLLLLLLLLLLHATVAAAAAAAAAVRGNSQAAYVCVLHLNGGSTQCVLQAHNCCRCHEQLPATAGSCRHYIVQRSLGVVGVGGVRCAQFEFFMVHLSDV